MITQNLSINFLRWVLSLAAVLAFLSFFVPVNVSAIDKAELCTGANLTFDESKKSCRTDDGTSSGGKCVNSAGQTVSCSENSINDLIAQIVNILSIIVGIAAVIMIIYGGFRYITSGGDSGNISTAKNIILYAIVGLIIVALAQILVKFILDKVAK